MGDAVESINVMGLFEAKPADYPVPKLVPVESYNSSIPNWFNLKLGKLTLAYFTCWWEGEANEPQKWDIILPGPEGLRATDTGFTDPVSAAHWFYLNFIKETPDEENRKADFRQVGVSQGARLLEHR